MSCPSCYEAVINKCSDIIVKAGLPPSTEFYVLLSKPGKTTIYERDFTTDAEGVLIVSIDGFPAGYFTQYGGPVQMQLKKKADYSLQNFSFGEPPVQYDCVLISLRSIDTEEGATSPVSTIQ